MSNERFIKSWALLILCFLKPQFAIWCWQYVQLDLGLPDPLSYWKMFWFMFGINCFKPVFYTSKKEFYEN